MTWHDLCHQIWPKDLDWRLHLAWSMDHPCGQHVWGVPCHWPRSGDFLDIFWDFLGFFSWDIGIGCSCLLFFYQLFPQFWGQKHRKTTERSEPWDRHLGSRHPVPWRAIAFGLACATSIGHEGRCSRWFWKDARWPNGVWTQGLGPSLGSSKEVLVPSCPLLSMSLVGCG